MKIKIPVNVAEKIKDKNILVGQILQTFFNKIEDIITEAIIDIDISFIK